MRCPICHSTQHFVADTARKGVNIKRRRQCEQCGHRWGTVEMGEADARKLERALAAAKQFAVEFGDAASGQ